MALAVPKIPLMDYVGTPLLACLFVALLLLQWRFPLRRHYFSVIKRLLRNFVLSIPGFAIVRLAMLPIPLMLAALQIKLNVISFSRGPTMRDLVSRRYARRL